MPVLAGERVRFRFTEPTRFGRITQVGTGHREGPYGWDPMRVLDSFALVYVLDGRGRYADGHGLTRDLEPGDALLVFPDLPHSYGPGPGERWTEHWLVFDGPVFDQWRADGLLDPARPVLHADPLSRWLPRLEAVPDAPRQPGSSLAETCRLLSVLADLLAHQARREDAAAGPRMVERACALLASDLERDLDLPAVARRLGLTYATFRSRFTRLMGVPPARWRGARIIERACELMQRGRLTDRQIADQLGFADEFHFSKRFKKITGRSPREFRRAHPGGGR